MEALFNNSIISSWADRQDYDVRFNCSRFLFYFLMHVILETMLPVTLLPFCLCFNKNQLRNMGFGRCNFSGIY